MRLADATCRLPYRIGAVFLLREDGAVLMQHRDDKPNLPRAGMWVVPGGHCESGESESACARREFREETLYQCGELRRLAAIVDINSVTGEEYELVIFWSRFDGVQAMRCMEGQDLKFIRYEEAHQYDIPLNLLEAWRHVLAAAGHLPATLQASNR